MWIQTASLRIIYQLWNIIFKCRSGWYIVYYCQGVDNLLWQNWSCHRALLKDDYWIQAIFKKWDRYCCLFYLKFYSVHQWNPIINVWILYCQNIIKYINMKLKALDLSVNLSLIKFYRLQHRSKGKIDKARSTVCSYGNAHDCLQNVPS